MWQGSRSLPEDGIISRRLPQVCESLWQKVLLFNLDRLDGRHASTILRYSICVTLITHINGKEQPNRRGERIPQGLSIIDGIVTKRPKRYK